MVDESAASRAQGRRMLVGVWEKITRGKCDELYPEQLEFSDRGIYFGKRDEMSASLYHPVWDAGRYEVIGEHQIKISTANDAEINYEFYASQETLTFRDRDGCEFKYRRLK
jgi:hypothetical protein